MGVNTTAVLWITLAALTLLIVTLGLVFWPALSRPRRSRPPGELPRRPPAQPPLAPARPVSRAAAPLPRPFTPTKMPPRPAPELPPLDPADPIVRRFEQVVAAVEQTYAAVRTVPEAFDERGRMRIEVMAVEQRLTELKTLLARADPGGRTTYSPPIHSASERLSSIRQDAEGIAATLARLVEHEQELSQSAMALSDELQSVARLAPCPIATERTSHLSAKVLGEVNRLPDRSALRSFNGLKVRLRMVKELRDEVERCREALATARRHREALLALLAGPELAEDAPWHRALATLHQRSRAVGASADSTAPVTEMMAEADRLLTRRRALLDFCTPMPQGGALLPEERLPAIQAEAEAIRAEVRALWQRARSLAAARSAEPREKSHG